MVAKHFKSFDFKRNWAPVFAFLIVTLGFLLRIGASPLSDADPVLAEIYLRAAGGPDHRALGYYLISWLRDHVWRFPLDARHLAILNSVAFGIAALGLLWTASQRVSKRLAILGLFFLCFNGRSASVGAALHPAVWYQALVATSIGVITQFNKKKGVALFASGLVVLAVSSIDRPLGSIGEILLRTYHLFGYAFFSTFHALPRTGFFVLVDRTLIISTVLLIGFGFRRWIWTDSFTGWLVLTVTVGLLLLAPDERSEIATFVPLWIVLVLALSESRNVVRRVWLLSWIIFSPGLDLELWISRAMSPPRPYFAVSDSLGKSLFLTNGEDPRLAWVPIAEGFQQPTGIYFLDARRVFITERSGSIWMLDLSTSERRKIASVNASLLHVEQGLIGLALPNDVLTCGIFYVHFTTLTQRGMRVRIDRFRVNNNWNQAENDGALVDMPFPKSDHWGGQMRFDSKGRLLVAVGAYAPWDSALILRLDVSGGSTIEKINDAHVFASGFRNPFSFSFSPQGELIVGDVGGQIADEIDLVREGENHGFPVFEGSTCFGAGRCESPRLIPPLVELRHPEMRAVIGGFVYNGANEKLRDHYLFADFTLGRLHALRWPVVSRPFRKFLGEAPITPSMIAEGPDGEPYVTSLISGAIYQLKALSVSR